MNEDQFQLYSHIFAKSFQIERGTPHAYHALYLSGQGVGKPHFPLFFLLGVESEERSTPGILQNIARAILSQAQTETISGEMQLIGICRYLNEYLVAVTRKPKAWCKRLQILIVAIDEEMLYLAAYGNVRAYLSRKRKFTDVVRAGAPLTPDRETHVNIPSKSQRSPAFFPFFLEGQLEAGDKLLFTSSSLFDYFNLEKLAELVAQRSADEFTHYVTRVLTTLPGNISVGGLVIEIREHEVLALQEKDVTADVGEPYNARRTTPGRFVPQPFIPPLDHKGQGLATSATHARRTILKRLTHGAMLYLQSMTQKLFVRINAAVRAVLPQNTTILPASNTKDSALHPGIFALILAQIARLYARFRKLPRTSQYFFLASVLLAILFLESIIAITNDRSRAREQRALNNAVNAIALQQAEAEAALIYGDEAKARLAVEQARSALQGLSIKSISAKEKFEELRNTFLTLERKVYRLETIEELPVLVDFAKLDGATVNVPGGLVISPPRLYSFATTEGTLYEIDPDNKTITIITGNTATATPLGWQHAALGERGEIYLLSTNGIIKFEPKTKTLTPISPSLNESVAAIATYGRRLYTLNRQSGLIERYETAQTPWRAPTLWLKDGVALPGATSMTIDGSIYVADASGHIRKFVLGTEEDFPFPTLVPPLTAPSRIVVDGTYLYVLEQTEKRIIIVSKEGKLVRQIVSPRFDRLTDIAPDLTKKILYVLSGTKIYSIPFSP